MGVEKNLCVLPSISSDGERLSRWGRGPGGSSGDAGAPGSCPSRSAGPGTCTRGEAGALGSCANGDAGALGNCRSGNAGSLGSGTSVDGGALARCRSGNTIRSCAVDAGVVHTGAENIGVSTVSARSGILSLSGARRLLRMGDLANGRVSGMHSPSGASSGRNSGSGHGVSLRGTWRYRPGGGGLISLVGGADMFVSGVLSI
jgi:hypothetical protein